MAHLRRPLLPVLLLAGALPVLAACGGTAQAEQLRSEVAHRPVEVTDAPALPDLLGATDRLGLDLLAITGPDENVVTSPASLVIALAMVGEGADGETAAELDGLLGASGAERTDAVNAARGALATWEGDPAVVGDAELPQTPLLHVANNVVVDDDAEILPTYLDALAQGYDAGLQQTDLAGEEGKEVLDAWVREHTGGLIEESAMVPDDDLRLVVQNAVVLAARWQVPFDANDTRPTEFVRADGSTVEVEMMVHSAAFRYAEVQGWQVVRLPYTDDRLMADVLLPPEGSGPQDLSADLQAELQAAVAAAEPAPVDLQLPKVDLQTRIDLLPLLEASTPTLVDRDRADLSRMSEDLLFVAQAQQQAVLRMDEDGTVAAAVTEVGVEATSAPAPGVPMVVDRPYLVRLAADLGEDEEAGSWTLFLARVADPTARS